MNKSSETRDMSDVLALMSAAELTERYAQKSLSPVEATRAALSVIAARDGVLNAFRLVDEEAALDAARRSEARWLEGAPLSPVDGVPTSVKDLLLTKGWPTLRGSRPGRKMVAIRTVTRNSDPLSDGSSFT